MCLLVFTLGAHVHMTIALPMTGNGPLYQRLYRAVRSGIEAGRLPCGMRLPSTRSLADELGVSRKVVLMAFERLEGEGFVRGQVGSGTYVAWNGASAVTVHSERSCHGGVRVPFRISRWAQQVKKSIEIPERAPAEPSTPVRYEFRRYRRDPEPLFPTTWHRLIVRASRQRLGPSEPAGADRALRHALAGHLTRVRGVPCFADQIVPVKNMQQGVDVVCRTLLDAGDHVAIEVAHDRRVGELIKAQGATLTPVATDDSGLVPAKLPDLADPVRLLHITPSHQCPTGAVLPRDRRLAVLRWAERTGAMILEDDTGAGFRYERSALEPLIALDSAARVVHLGALFPATPGLPLAYLVLPVNLAPLFREALRSMDAAGLTVEQEALIRFIEDGHLVRHARIARIRYDARRRTLLEALRSSLGVGVPIQGEHAGVHVLVWLPGVAAQQLPEVRRRALEAGIGIETLDGRMLDAPAPAGLVMGYGAIRDDQIRPGVAALSKVLNTVVMSSRLSDARAAQRHPPKTVTVMVPSA